MNILLHKFLLSRLVNLHGIKPRCGLVSHCMARLALWELASPVGDEDLGPARGGLIRRRFVGAGSL